MDGLLKIDRKSMCLAPFEIEFPAPRCPRSPRELADRSPNIRMANTPTRRSVELAGGNQTKAAKMLGMSRFGLQKMVRRQENEE